MNTVASDNIFLKILEAEGDDIRYQGLFLLEGSEGESPLPLCTMMLVVSDCAVASIAFTLITQFLLCIFSLWQSSDNRVWWESHNHILILLTHEHGNAVFIGPAITARGCVLVLRIVWREGRAMLALHGGSWNRVESIWPRGPFPGLFTSQRADSKNLPTLMLILDLFTGAGFGNDCQQIEWREKTRVDYWFSFKEGGLSTWSNMQKELEDMSCVK